MNSAERTKESFYEKLNKITNIEELQGLKHEFLGPDSSIKNITTNVHKLPSEERKTCGQWQKLEKELEAVVGEYFLKFKQNNRMKMDYSLPVYSDLGEKNLLMEEINNIKTLVMQMSFVFHEVPDIDSEDHCFTYVNLEARHPARDIQQSLFLGNNKVLRPHSTNLEHHILKNHSHEPYAAFTIGRCFRRDQADATHTPMFHQLELVEINHGGLKQMKTQIQTFLNLYFQKEVIIRFRHSYFPFTVISFEVDAWFNNRWIEIMGAGVLHPNLYKYAGVETTVGWACGIGVERLVCIKHNIKDIREFYA